MNWIEINEHDENANVPEKGETVLVWTGSSYFTAAYAGWDKTYMNNKGKHIFLENVEGYSSLRVYYWCRIIAPFP